MGKVRLEFVMDKSKDRKMIKWLETKNNKGGYIKNLIRQDIRENS